MTVKIWTRDEINEMLRTNDKAVERAIVRLFELQNADEQRFATTNVHNNRGFCSSDARAGTRFARWIQGLDDKNRKKFPAKSLNHPRAYRIFRNYCKNGEGVIGRARRIAIKHSRQLVEIANEKAQVSKPEIKLSKVESGVKNEPQSGTWAHTARMMASMDNSGFDWDAWKDEMKDKSLGL